MRYEFQIRLTEADYLSFNVFHLTRSPYGRQTSCRLKGLVAGMFAVAVAAAFLYGGVNASTVLYAVLMALLGGAFLLKYDRFVGRSMARTIKQMTKTGKMPYAPDSQVIFDGDVILEITPEQRTERTWSGVERLCMVDGKVWYLYLNNASGFILPVDQLRAQTDFDEFLRYVTEKCPRLDRID